MYIDFYNQTEKEVEIELDYKYKFPEDIQFIEYKGKFLIVAVETGNWIVADNPIQLTFFKLLQKHTIGDSIKLSSISDEDCSWILTQIEARQLESTKTVRKSQSEGIQLYLTQKCNLRCPHCYMYAGNAAQNELTDDELIDLVKAVGEHGTEKITFSGGEATLHHLLPTLIRLSYSNGMKIDLLTNGLLISESFINECGQYLDRVQVSIDGYSEESNMIHRGKGSFDRALQAVDLLLKHGINTDIGITPPFSNSLHEDIDKYVAFINYMRSKYKDYPLTLAFTGSLMDGRELHLGPDEAQYYSECIKSICKKCFGKHYAVIGFIQFKKLLGIDDNCPYGDLNIASNGDVYYCSHITAMEPMGNIRELTWSEVYTKSQEAKRLSNINNIEPCSECPIKYICGGNCRIDHIPEFLNCASIPEHPRCVCKQGNKELIYQLMIDTNEYIFH